MIAPRGNTEERIRSVLATCDVLHSDDQILTLTQNEFHWNCRVDAISPYALGLADELGDSWAAEENKLNIFFGRY